MAEQWAKQWAEVEQPSIDSLGPQGSDVKGGAAEHFLPRASSSANCSRKMSEISQFTERRSVAASSRSRACVCTGSRKEITRLGLSDLHALALLRDAIGEGWTTTDYILAHPRALQPLRGRQSLLSAQQHPDHHLTLSPARRQPQRRRCAQQVQCFILQYIQTIKPST